jgi:hypothetical protein
MRGQYYAFVPFTDDELKQTLPDEVSVRTIARIWKQDAEGLMVEKRKQPIIIQYKENENALLNGSFDVLHDTIYIIGHCHKGGNSLGSSRAGFHFSRAEVDGKNLVARLGHYIPTGTINFKLLACFGGSPDQTVEDGLTTIKSDSFASKLFKELKIVYTSAVLTAYLLPVKAGLDPDGHKIVTLEDGTGNAGRASANRIKFS